MITTVLLSFNRLNLLKRTVESYLKTISVPFELIIVDNNSSHEVQEYIRNLCKNNPKVKGIFLTENLGGKAINFGLEKARGDFFHISENDLEYLPNWDKELLKKFEIFPKLGQLSLYSPTPQSDEGEIWEIHPSKPISQGDETIFLPEVNVATPSIFRREIFDKGVRWENKATEKNSFVQFPSDTLFSLNVKKLGYLVAWNDKYVVKNWGHNIKEMINDLDYYLENYRAKGPVGINGFKKRLRENGYDLIKEDGKYKIIKLDKKLI